MTAPTNTTVDVLKSMVDHPAGRQRPARQTLDSPGRHRPAPGRPQVGHLDERRDGAPNPSAIDGVTLVLLLVLGTLFGAGLIISQLWHALGLFGAALGVLIVANIIWIWKDGFMVANSDNPRVDVPPMIREELARRAEMLGGFTANGRQTKWQLVGESMGVDPRVLRRLASGAQKRVLSTTLDLLVVRLGLVGYVDGFSGQELMGATA